MGLNKQRFKADRFWVMSIERVDNIDKEEDVRNRDVTHIFHSELMQRIKNNELININVNGNVRLGKSTLAMQLCSDVKGYIKLYKGKERPMSNQNVLRDQNEYARMFKRRPEDFKHECDVIDEWSEMETAGFNATIEQKYLKQISDVQAGRYYHRIACSPTMITDENSDLLLTVVPGARKEGYTLCLLYYRLNRGNMTEPILLGHTITDVRPTLKAEWYKEYLKKKEEKWELMNKHNVKSPRELEYAKIVLNTYNAIRDMAEDGLTARKYIKPYLQEQADKQGIWFSILGDKDILDTMEGLAERKHLIARYEHRLTKARTPEQKQRERERLDKHKQQLDESLKRQAKLSNLWEKYQLI